MHQVILKILTLSSPSAEPPILRSPIRQLPTVTVPQKTPAYVADESASHLDDDETQYERPAMSQASPDRSTTLVPNETSIGHSSVAPQSPPPPPPDNEPVIRVILGGASGRHELVDMDSISLTFDQVAAKMDLDGPDVSTCRLYLRDPPEAWTADACSMIMRRDYRGDYERFKNWAMRAARKLPGVA